MVVDQYSFILEWPFYIKLLTWGFRSTPIYTSSWEFQVRVGHSILETDNTRSVSQTGLEQAFLRR